MARGERSLLWLEVWKGAFTVQGHNDTEAHFHALLSDNEKQHWGPKCSQHNSNSPTRTVALVGRPGGFGSAGSNLRAASVRACMS